MTRNSKIEFTKFHCINFAVKFYLLIANILILFYHEYTKSRFPDTILFFENYVTCLMKYYQRYTFRNNYFFILNFQIRNHFKLHNFKSLEFQYDLTLLVGRINLDKLFQQLEFAISPASIGQLLTFKLWTWPFDFQPLSSPKQYLNCLRNTSFYTSYRLRLV